MYIQYYILPNYTTTEEVTGRAVENGDTANIDFVGYIDGEAFDGGTGTGYDLTIGAHQFIDGFEDGLIGVNIGETVSLNLKFPDPYERNPDLAGVPVIFEVTVNSISKQVTPELNDEFVQTLGIEGCKTEKDLRDYVYNYFYETEVQ
ncbi:MAG: FKBP-type peptidyl-prolyl cis-trans isomerase, partial [Lachnospiraceae bacterium]|nr:FKBP-type peptidyl-prolyl cis-trans isomerase [Lachnospiraceae bacterium]